jgi:large subunit ribosomal protein L11
MTKDMQGVLTPVEITVYKDKSFTFIIKTPPASVLLKQVVGVVKGSSTPNKQKIGEIKKQQLKEIAAKKLKDLNVDDIDAAAKIIEGTARNMGIRVVD